MICSFKWTKWKSTDTLMTKQFFGPIENTRNQFDARQMYCCRQSIMMATIFRYLWCDVNAQCSMDTIHLCNITKQFFWIFPVIAYSKPKCLLWVFMFIHWMCTFVVCSWLALLLLFVISKIENYWTSHSVNCVFHSFS